MRSFIPLAAAVLPVVLACDSPDSHPCASAFAHNTADAAAFCATYTTAVVSATDGVPSVFNTACGGAAKSLSKECTCYVTAGASEATSSAVVVSQATTTAVAPSTFATSVKTAASSAVAAATSAAAPAATTAVAATTAAHAAATAGVGGTALSSLAGGSGVGGSTCTVTEVADATAALKTCSNVLLDGVTVSASTTLSVTVPSGGALLFGGTMTVEYTPDADYTPLVFKGSNAKIVGLAGAVIDGQGAKYWDGEGSNGGTAKPDHFFKVSDMESSSLSELTIQNWPTHLFSLDGVTDFTISNVILDNSAGDETDSDGDALGHNTDAFDVSSVDGLYVSGATVYNQDDCVAVNSGSNIVFENMYCSGGHGLSIGSVDSGVTISNVTFKDSSVINSENGCRIKTDADGSDSTVSDITYSNIYLSEITDYAIDIQQDYENGSPTGDPSTGITISGVTMSSISGTTSGDDAYSYYILCGSTSSCTDFTFTDIDISGGQTECSPSTSLCPSS